MTLNKQLINLLGVLVVVVVLVLGVALIGMPMYAQAQTINANADSVDQTNATYQVQIDALSAANDRIDEIDRDLEELRGEIAAAPQLDDVHEIVDAAAKAADIRIESIVADTVEQWASRGAQDADGNPVAAPAVEPASDADADAEATDTVATDGSAVAATPADNAANESPQKQVLLTVIVDVRLPYALPGAEGDDPDVSDSEGVDPADARAGMTADAQRAAAFVDALGAGPRLLLPINLDYNDGKLTLSVITFIRTEDQ